MALRGASTDPSQAETVRWDELLVRLAEAADIGLVTDYFTRARTVRLNKSSYSIGELLDGFEKQYDAIHWWDGDTLMVRSLDWVEARQAEPPAAVLDRLAAIDPPKSKPSFEDLLDVAQGFSDEQLATLEWHTNPEAEPLSVNLAPRLRANADWLRAYAALSLAERAQARRPAGLALERLEAGARQAWAGVLLHRGLWLPDSPTPARLHVATMRTAVLPGMESLPEAHLASPLAGGNVTLWRDARSDDRAGASDPAR